MKKYAAEFFGTFWLVLGGCGSAVLAAAFPEVGIGLVGVSIAFGLTVLTMAYAIGHISGCHLNPAVSVGLWAGGRFPADQLLPYIVCQVLGAFAAGGVPDAVADGISGRLIPAGDNAAFAEAVCSLLEQPPDRAPMRAFAEGFAWAKFAPTLRQLMQYDEHKND